MKILDISAGVSIGFINDFHISKEKIGVSRTNWSEFLSILKTRGIKTAVIGGDLFEARDSQTLNVLISVRDMFNEAADLGINIILANGNHDKVNQEDNNGYCHLYADMKNVTVVDTWNVIESPSANIFILAYFPETGSLIDKLKDIESSDYFNNGKTNVLYAHAGVLGALGRENEHEIDVKSFLAFDKVYMGHYHGRTKIGNVEYIGSSRQYTYGEDYIKGYNICDADGDLEFIQNKVNDRMFTINVDFNDLPNAKDIVGDIHKDNEDCEGNIHIRFIVSVPTSKVDLINKDELRAAGVNRIEIKAKVDVSQSVSSSFYKKYDKEQIIETYKGYCTEQHIDSSLGLTYLK